MSTLAMRTATCLEQSLQPLQFLLGEHLGPDGQRRGHLLYQVVDPVAAVNVAALETLMQVGELPVLALRYLLSGEQRVQLPPRRVDHRELGGLASTWPPVGLVRRHTSRHLVSTRPATHQQPVISR